jgi:RHS repeat-associated protein
VPCVNNLTQYGPFGNVISSASPIPDAISYGDPTADGDMPPIPDGVGFGGQWGCQTMGNGLILCGQRWYNPSTGRWLTRDPIGYEGGIDLYDFCNGNPVMLADPSGTDALILYGTNRHTIDGTPDPDAWKRKALMLGQDYEREAPQIVRTENMAAMPVSSSPGKIVGETLRVPSPKLRAYVVQVTSLSQFQSALKAHKNIDTIIYVGHGTGMSCCLSPTYNLHGADVAKLDSRNVTKNAYIELDGCHSGDGGDGSIAQAFADHFHTDVVAYAGGSSFGIPIPLTSYRISPQKVRTWDAFGMAHAATRVVFSPR